MSEKRTGLVRDAKGNIYSCSGWKTSKRIQPHVSHGNRQGQWECHIKSDWLLVWEQNDKEMTLLMVNTETHSDLFK